MIVKNGQLLNCQRKWVQIVTGRIRKGRMDSSIHHHSCGKFSEADLPKIPHKPRYSVSVEANIGAGNKNN